MHDNVDPGNPDALAHVRDDGRITVRRRSRLALPLHRTGPETTGDNLPDALERILSMSPKLRAGPRRNGIHTPTIHFADHPNHAESRTAGPPPKRILARTFLADQETWLDLRPSGTLVVWPVATREGPVASGAQTLDVRVAFRPFEIITDAVTEHIPEDLDPEELEELFENDINPGLEDPFILSGTAYEGATETFHAGSRESLETGLREAVHAALGADAEAYPVKVSLADTNFSRIEAADGSRLLLDMPPLSHPPTAIDVERFDESVRPLGAPGMLRSPDALAHFWNVVAENPFSQTFTTLDEGAAFHPSGPRRSLIIHHQIPITVKIEQPTAHQVVTALRRTSGAAGGAKPPIGS